MTDSSTPAAWYPDPAGSTRQRWWDGTQWTENYSEPYTGLPATTSTLGLQQGVKTYTLWVWLIVGVLALSLISMLTFNFREYMLASLYNPTNPLAMFTPSYLFIMATSFLAYWGAVALAFLDHRELTRGGIQRPFHWAFAFISPIVYLIGRAVVLKRRIGAGSATMWIAIGYMVVSAIITILWIVSAVNLVLEYMPPR
ncbi:MAG: DUF2510 domain-containing protein [Microbacteriaceae bacterium]